MPAGTPENRFATASSKSPGEAASSPSVAETREPLDDDDLEAGQLICVVGDEYILAGDMFVFVEPILEENRSRLSSAQEKKLRAQLTRQVLTQYVEIKALYQEFFRDMVGTGGPKELRETRQKVTSKANRLFYEKQVPNLLSTYEATDLASLEQKLRAKGVSLNVLRSQFIERVLGGELERKYVSEEVEITREELLQQYAQRSKEWERPGRARWRQLTARFDRYPTRQAARAAIEEMGNEVFLGGKPFEAVARDRSHGFTAAKGGVYDWTTQGGLKSQPLNEALFTLPVQRLSLVIEDDLGYHIVEVLEREEARMVPFEEVQFDIRHAIRKEKLEAAREAYRKQVMARTVIWTRWPEDIPGSRSLQAALGESGLTSATTPR
jgi:hypothetical protein